MKKSIILLGQISGAIIAIFSCIGFFGKPFLDDYVDHKIDIYEKELIKKNSSKVKLRKLMSEKMGIDQDEVHIEIGKMYKNYQSVLTNRNYE